MDFLGLRNLTVLQDAVRNIEVSTGETLVLEQLPLDDLPTYQLLASGYTLGVFQLDGGPMRSLLRLLKPDCFEDIAAVLALYRPGPMGADSHTNYALRKNGKQPITPIHPELAEPLAEILAPTYGLIVYQEQVMEIPQKLAGYSLGRAGPAPPGDGQEEARGARGREGGLRRGHEGQRLLPGRGRHAVGDPGPVLRLRLQQVPHRGLRAGLLLDGLPQGQLPRPVHGRAAVVGEGRQGQDGALPQRVPPDEDPGAAAGRQRVRTRRSPRSARDIRFGLTAIRNVGANVVGEIVRARADRGRFTDFNDFMERSRRWSATSGSSSR